MTELERQRQYVGRGWVGLGGVRYNAAKGKFTHQTEGLNTDYHSLWLTPIKVWINRLVNMIFKSSYEGISFLFFLVMNG